MDDTSILHKGRLPLYGLIFSSLFYAGIMSYYTFENNQVGPFKQNFIDGKKIGSYKPTLLATTIGSYIGSMSLIVIALYYHIKDIRRMETGFLWGAWLFGLSVLIALTALLAYFANNENIFGTTSKEAFEYNYPFVTNIVYIILFFSLGLFFIKVIDNNKTLALSLHPFPSSNIEMTNLN